MNKRRRWCHSSRVKVPFVRRSANGFRVSTNFALGFGVQDKSVEYPVQGHSVTAGDTSHRRTSFLITTSLSATMSSEASWRESLAMGVTYSAALTLFFRPFVGLLLTVFVARPVSWWSGVEIRRKQSFKKQKRTQRSRAGKPSVGEPASKEITSDSVEPFETAVCFLHIQLIGTIFDSRRYTVLILHEVEFEASRSPAKAKSWKNPNRQCCKVFSHSTKLPKVTCAVNVLDQASWTFCHKLVHFVTARASLFTDYRISGLPMRAKYRNVTTIWEQTNHKLPPFLVLLAWTDGRQDLVMPHCEPIRGNVRRIPRMSSHVVGPGNYFCTISLWTTQRFHYSYRDSAARTLSGIRQQEFHPKYTLSRNGARFLQINVFHEFLPREFEIVLLPSHFDVVHEHR